MTPAWGRELTLGVEEELFLVDAATLETMPAFSRLVPERPEHLKAEVFECLLEITTPVCSSADEALAELRRLREGVARRAALLGAAYLAGGTHPLARGAGQPVVPEQRYRKLREELGKELDRQLVCGLHVHVGMPSAEACLRCLEGIVPWLPTLLALSANSPYAEGEETGARSTRAGRLAELESVGPPPLLRTWADWEHVTGGRDYTRIWWDARPHPRHGTLEVRVADQQSDVRRTAGFAALVQALAAAVLDAPMQPYDRRRYAARRARAARAGPDPAEVEVLAVLVEPAAREHGSWELARVVLEGEPEAERQLAVGRAEGLDAVVQDLAARSVA